MSIDACKITNNSSIFLKKIRPSTNSSSNNVVLLKDTDNDIQVKKSRSTSLNKLQSVGLSLVASVTKKRSSNNNNTATTTTNRKSTQQVINKKHVSTNSLPTVNVAPATSTLPPPQMRLRPSISARPFSQFFFPIKEEKEEDTTFEQPSIMYNKNRMGHLKNERGQLPPQQTQRNKQQQQQQQQKHQKLRACKKLNTSKRHSIAIDLNSSHEDTNNITSSSNTSSRSSSLKTVKSHSIIDNVVIATNDTVEIQSEITFAAATNTTAKKRNLSRSVSQLQQIQQNSNSNNNRLSSVARARTVLRLDSVKSREMRAISVWKDTVSQLSLDDLHYDDSNNSSIEEEEQELQEDDELYEILTHPALIPEQTLERQRFVRRSSPKDMAMMKFILNELIATEKSYNQLLLLIQNRYMKPMVEASQSKDPLVKSSDIPLLFNHLPQLVQLSDRLLDQFTKTSNIGHVFKSIESDLVVFLKYAMHYRTNLKTIRKACSNVLFVKIDQETLAKRDSNRLGMSDYFIAPIQRIPRYCLLIKDLQKYTHPMDTNYLELDFALKTLTGLAVAMDHVQNKVPSNTRTSIRTL